MHFEGMHGYIVNRKWDGARGGPFGVKSLSLTIGSILKRRRFLARHFGSFSLRLHSLSAKIKRARIRALFISAPHTVASWNQIATWLRGINTLREAEAACAV